MVITSSAADAITEKIMLECICEGCGGRINATKKAMKYGFVVEISAPCGHNQTWLSYQCLALPQIGLCAS